MSKQESMLEWQMLEENAVWPLIFSHMLDLGDEALQLAGSAY
jgi:hypothetical protein